MINIICALARNHAIGHQGQLIYRLPADLRRFKALTTGHTVVMGRRTFESLPKGALPNRRNIVLTRQSGLSFPGAETFASLTDALAPAATAKRSLSSAAKAFMPKPCHWHRAFTSHTWRTHRRRPTPSSRPSTPPRGR